VPNLGDHTCELVCERACARSREQDACFNVRLA